jgi:hypothetical protein
MSDVRKPESILVDIMHCWKWLLTWKKKKVKQSLYTHHGGAWGERRYSSYSFTTSALDGWVVSITPRPRFTPGERTPSTHCTGGWVGPRASLDTEARGKILCPRRGSNPDRPVVQPVVRHYTAWANPAPVARMRHQSSAQASCTRISGLWHQNFHTTNMYNC